MIKKYNPRKVKSEGFGLSSGTLSIFFISACGSSSHTKKDQLIETGFSSDYVSPPYNYEQPLGLDDNFKILMPSATTPYWVDSLEMENGKEEIAELLSSSNGIFFYSFPLDRPDYIPIIIAGWAPASDKMQQAVKEIFSQLNRKLNTEFRESESSSGFNNIAISQSTQTLTAGYGFFPNNDFELGSDIFISKAYNSPTVYPNLLTDYDYEVLVHEIGHALGLKHPFEGDRSNLSILKSPEENTKFTAMSYNEDSLTFDGTFRVLDWMALTKLYGVNPQYKPQNDIYYFSSNAGTFIIDGGGIDTIDASTSNQDIFLDLRHGTHSYQGQKSDYISDPNQLTISHGSVIENIYTGTGDDYLVGNDFANIIITEAGNNQIFPGDGTDTIICGSGSNTIDLSEEINFQDKIIIDSTNSDTEPDTVFGFHQGETGDVIEFKDFLFDGIYLLPLVTVQAVPIGNIANSLLRIFGNNLKYTDTIESHFVNDGVLKNLKLGEKESAIILTANTQNTGEEQRLYSINNQENEIEVVHLATFIGSYLDIDSWAHSNFVVL